MYGTNAGGATTSRLTTHHHPESLREALQGVDPKKGPTQSQIRSAIEVLYGGPAAVDHVLAHNVVTVSGDGAIHMVPKGKWEE